MNVYVDADGCPVKNEIYRASEKYGATVYVVCNRYMNVPTDPRIRLVVVEAGPDVADDWIAERAAPGDLVVTSDIPLADRCLKAGARVLDVRGREFTPDSIGGQMATRSLMEQLRMMGEMGGGPPPVEKKDRTKFVEKFHHIMQALVRAPR